MDADKLKRDMEALCPGASVHISGNEGFYWVSKTVADPNGQTHTHSVAVPTDATPLDLQIAAARLKAHRQDE